VIEEQLTIERAPDAVADHDDARRVPAPEWLRRDARARGLVAAAVVVVEAEIIRERVLSHEIVASVGEAEDDAAGSSA
jgi:hypothetical protein